MKLPACLLLTILCLAPAWPLRAAGFGADAAEALIAKNQNALVEIHATLTIKPELIEGPPGIADMLNQQKEQEQEVTAKGIVIHSGGLIAAPLAALDPTAIMADGMELDTPLGKIKIGMKADFSAVKIITSDGHEYPADVVRKEAAAGLVLLKINSPPAEGMTAVALAKDLPAPLPFSRALALTRLGADFARAPAVRVLRIAQTTPPPTPLYDITGPLAEPGTAVFDAEGRFIGMSVIPLRKSASATPAVNLFILPLPEIVRLAGKAIP